MSLRYRVLVALTLALAALPSRALFHLWAIDEIYSNADGTVQYAELVAFSGSQQFLKNHTLVAGTGPGARTFTFPADLPGDTAGKRMLIGTTAFAAQGIVAPDYVVPNNFFDFPNGTVSFAEGADTWNYAGVPAGGTVALFRSGATGTRTPTNFAGMTPNPPRLLNISTRGQVQTGDNVMIGGFIIGGSAPKSVLVRARGPSLAQFGVPGVLANPVLQLFSGQSQIASNDNWQQASNVSAIQASGFAPTDANESAILTVLNPGPYTAIVTGAGGSTGVGIVEVFEADAVEVPLINISTRGLVQTGDNVMIGGFIITGSGNQTVVVRARGPSLSPLGVPGVLANPSLELYTGQTLVASNDNWQDASNMSAIQASGQAPTDANESAILMSLAPGGYTAIVRGVGGTTGIGIVEVFTVP